MTPKKSIYPIFAVLVFSTHAGASSTSGYNASIRMMTTDGQQSFTKLYKSAEKQRSEVQTGQGEIVSLLNFSTKEAYTFSKSDNGPLGNKAMKLNYEQIISNMGPQPQDMLNSLTRLGTDIVAENSCTNYLNTQQNIISCITHDKIVLRNMKDGNIFMEVTQLQRGYPSESLFKVPESKQILDISQNSGPKPTPSYGSAQMLEDQAGKQTKRQIEKQTRKLLGGAIGGAIGGSLIGNLIGNEAGNASKGIVGGIFKSKKTPPKPEDKTQNENENSPK